MADTVYKGIIAGIGDILSGTNVIRPWFDARVRNFIIGQDGILDGFTLKDGILDGGICVARGYVGEFVGGITVSSSNFIYGKFVIHMDDNTPDEFWVIISDSPLTFENADILHEPGEYIIPLKNNTLLNTEGIVRNYSIEASIDSGTPPNRYYGIKYVDVKNWELDRVELNQTGDYGYATVTLINSHRYSVRVNSPLPNRTLNVSVTEYYKADSNLLAYPLNAHNSDYTDVVKSDGYLENGVTAVTQALDDNSTKVATTEFVQSLLAKKLSIATYDNRFVVRTTTILGMTNTWYLNVHIERKANYCIFNANLSREGENVSLDGSFTKTLGKIETDFIPVEEAVCAYVGSISNMVNDERVTTCAKIIIYTSGNITMIAPSGFYIHKANLVDTMTYNKATMGYKANVK